LTEPKINTALADGSTTTDEIKACFALRIKKTPIIQAAVKHVNIMATHHVRDMWLTIIIIIPLWD
jgi:hypothetical protein